MILAAGAGGPRGWRLPRCRTAARTRLPQGYRHLALARRLRGIPPRLARALTSARLPVLRRRPLVAGGPQHAGAWIAAILASLLAGIALLTAGLVLDVVALAGRHPGPARADGAHPCAPRRTC